MTTAEIHVRDLHKTYRRGGGDVHALRGLDLDVAPGALVVLTATLYQQFAPTYPKVDQAAWERAWVEGQRHWATYSDVSEMVSVPNAGHFIHFDQLNVVVAAVLRML